MPASTYNPQAIMPGWADPQQASVFDSPITSLIRAIVGGAQAVGRKTGLNDPQNQLLAIMNPMDVGPNGGLMGAIQNYIKAYHGSPHDFERFSMDKIGTGEGAQAYGHGLYFAENPGVAQSYRDALSAARVNGAALPDVLTMADPVKDRAMFERELSKLTGEMEQWRAAGYDKQDWMQDRIVKQQRTIDAIRGAIGDPSSLSRGRMYEVAIHATPDQLLDLDKPIEQQPQAVLDIIREKLKEQKYLGPNDNGPRQLKAAIRSWKMERGGMSETPMESLVGRGGLLGKTPEEVSQTLQARGIPGAQYFDAGSRDVAKGTRNYVIWDDKLISILKKYGLAAPVIEGLRQEAMKHNGQIDRAKLEQVMQ